MYLSLCMIVKNEEQVLKRCLDSVKGIVDEIIIADTGSTDDTVEIASEYTEHFYNFEWTDSFSDARNFVQKKASGKWILVLDADEYVDRNNLIEIKERLMEKENTIDAFFVTIYNFVGLSGERIVQHRNMRIYRNDPAIKFTRAIHEQLVHDNARFISDSLDLIIYHTGYLDKTVKDKNKGMRNVKLLEKQTETEGQEAFDYFNMGNEFFSSKEIEKALDSYQKAYLLIADKRLGWVAMTVVQIILCLVALKRYDEAIKVITNSERNWSGAPEFKYLRGAVYILQNRIYDAKEVLLNLVKDKEKYKSFIRSIDYLELHPYMALGDIYEKEENFSEAISCYAHVLSVNSKNSEAIYKLMSILTKYCSREEVIQFISAQKLFNEKNHVRLIMILLEIGDYELVHFFIDKFNIKENITDGMQPKLIMLRDGYRAGSDYVIKSSDDELHDNLNKGFIDKFDIYLLCLAAGESDLYLKIDKMINDEFILAFLKDRVITAEPIKYLYLVMLERCIKYKWFDLFESLLSVKTEGDMSIKQEIGHLLCKYDFYELALEFYDNAGNVQQLDESAFIDIIKILIKLNDRENALQFALKAVESGFTNFIIFENAIEILDESGEINIKNKIKRLALKHYPDSIWLKKR